MTFRCAWQRAGAALALLLPLAAHPATLRAQSSFETAIRQYSASDIEGYIQPLADVLVSNLSSAYFPVPTRSKFGISVELVGLATTVTDKMKTYTAKTPPGFTPSTFQTPTIFGGPATPVNNTTISGLSYRGSDGILDASIFPIAVPQVSVGGFFGTEVVGRYFTSSLMGSAYPKDDLPELKMTGFGIRHSVSQYLHLPIDLAVSYSYSSFTLGDYLDIDATAYGVNVGKSLGSLAVTGGLESSGGKMNVSYTSTNPTASGPVNIDLDSKRQTRFVAGASLGLGFVKLVGTAGFGSFTTYSGGLRIGF